METVAFDESGNTGADLLNDQQAVFILASTNLTREESDGLLSIVHTHQTKEAKFTALKKSSSGKKRIIEFVKQSIPYQKRIKTTFYHKRYMVITKIVDIIIETMLKADGIDLYKDGANIAMSNMHYYCMDSFCGKERADEMYKSFVKMVRTQNQESIDNFYYHAWQAYGASVDIEYQSSLAPILASESFIMDILDDIDSNSLDPAIPSFYEHCANWGDTIGSHFDVLHDNSKPIFQEKESLESFMSKDIPSKRIGYDRRTHVFPLKANGVCFGDSKNDSRLQVVDLIAGSAGFWANCIANGDTNNEFWDELNSLDINQFAINALWPHPEVTPAELGTDGGGGINAVDYITEQLLKKKK